MCYYGVVWLVKRSKLEISFGSGGVVLLSCQAVACLLFYSSFIYFYYACFLFITIILPSVCFYFYIVWKCVLIETINTIELKVEEVHGLNLCAHTLMNKNCSNDAFAVEGAVG